MRQLRAATAAGDARGLVGLTFDDGYAGFPEYVLPVLSDHGFSATVFALAGRFGGWNDWDQGPERALLTAEQLADVSAAGVEIGSHGLSHLRLVDRSPEELKAEIIDSRSILREVTGSPIDGFCYPYGSFDNAARQAVRDAGYDYACAVSPVERDDRFLVSRAFVGDRDGPVRLAAKLAVHRLAQGRR